MSIGQQQAIYLDAASTRDDRHQYMSIGQQQAIYLDAASTRDDRHQYMSIGQQHAIYLDAASTRDDRHHSILVGAYGKRSYSDDSKQTTNSTRQSYPKTINGNQKRWDNEYITILVETHSDHQALAPHCHSQHATRVGFLDFQEGDQHQDPHMYINNNIKKTGTTRWNSDNADFRVPSS
jgi:hypothetical protein